MRETSHAFSLEEVIAAANAWCEKHALTPAVGQAGDKITDRTFRYYRTIGLLDGPGDGFRYGRKHLLQLQAIKTLQAKSLGLPKIRSLIFGKSEAELGDMVERLLKDAKAVREGPLPDGENWVVTPVTGEFLLMSRSGRAPTQGQLEKIRAILRTGNDRGPGEEGGTKNGKEKSKS